MTRAPLLLGLVVALLGTGAWLLLRSERVEPPLAATREAPESRPASAPETLRSPATRSSGPALVQVVGASGQPINGITVLYAWRALGAASRSTFALGQTAAPDGTLALDDLDQTLALARGADRSPTEQGLTLQTAGVPVELVRLDGGSAGERVRFVLPPSGTVSFELTGARGEPISQLVNVELRVQGANGATTTQSAAHRGRFHGVPLGRTLRVSATSASQPLVRELAGPERDGDDVRVALSMPDGPVLCGSVVTEGGAPAAERTLQAVALTPSTLLATHVVRTDANGRFSWALAPELAGRTLESLTLYDRGEPRPRATAKCGSALRSGPNELGRLVLGAAPLLVSYAVVDEVGAPVATARGVVRGAGEMMAFDQQQRSIGPGRWVVHGSTTAAELELELRDRECILRKVKFVPGARDLRIVLERGGSLAAWLGDAPEGVVFALCNEATPMVHLAPGPEQVWTHLAAGSYMLLALTPLDVEPVVLLAGLRVESGKRCDDPRLAQLDLRARLRTLRVRVIDAAGKPPSYGATIRGRVEVRCGEDGTASVACAGASMSFVVRAHGYRAKQVRNVARDTTVALEQGALVRARLAPVTLPQGTRLWCYAEMPGAPPGARSRSAIGAPGEILALAPLLSPGPNELGFCVKNDKHLVILAKRTIEVRELDEPQLFEVECTPQELERALAELER